MSNKLNHENLMRGLRELERSEGEIILLSKDSEDNKMKILFSSLPISEYQKQLIRGVLENSSLPVEKSDICIMKPALKNQKILAISRKTVSDLTNHYRNLFVCLSQAICKEVAKQWIKIAEPNKQALYPYKYFNDSKPPWWPSCVNHIEPDHLDKYGRIKVLINILRNPEFPLETLRIRTKVLTFKNLIVHNILDELYYIAAYDRLFFDQFRKKSTLFDNLLENDKGCFAQETLYLKVSDVDASNFFSKKSGIIMVSQIKNECLNQISFCLSEIPGNIAAKTSVATDMIKLINSDGEGVTTQYSNINILSESIQISPSVDAFSLKIQDQYNGSYKSYTKKKAQNEFSILNASKKNNSTRYLQSDCPISKRLHITNRDNEERNSLYGDAQLSFVEKFNEYMKRKHEAGISLKGKVNDIGIEVNCNNSKKFNDCELDYKFPDISFTFQKNQNLITNNKVSSLRVKGSSLQISDNYSSLGSEEDLSP